MVQVNSEAVVAPRSATPAAQPLLRGEIAGAEVHHHALPPGAAVALGAAADRLRILVLLSGAVVADGVRLDGRACHVPRLGRDVRLHAEAQSEVLRIEWALTAAEAASLAEAEALPLTQDYAACEQYRDYFKSEKTISRTIVHPHVLPRFCMGSVESAGPDRIEPHAHPMLDQFFYGFAENDITLLVDGDRHPMGGSTLLHVPLGSDHGVEVPPGRRMHYIWMDFFARGEDMDYIVDVHKPVPSRTLQDAGGGGEGPADP